MTERELIFDNLKRMADAVVASFGRQCEVVIHDFEDLERSLVHVSGNVTNRLPGAPATDFVLRVLREEGQAARDVHNYRTTTRDGRTLKSSTLFARDSTGRIIGCACINFDITDYLNAGQLLRDLTFSPEEGGSLPETFAATVGETIASLVDEAVARIGKQPATMSKEEKLLFVEILERKGGFLIKGAVDQAALLLGVSKFTVYNYLQQVRAAHAVQSAAAQR